ncbi:amidohydrolase family protein [Halovulum sp. GXIMD14794]
MDSAQNGIARLRDLLGDIPLIDGHHHFWELDRFPYRWLSPEAPPARFGDKALIRRDYGPREHQAEFAGLPLSGSVHVQANCGAADPVEETRWVQSLADESGHPIVIVAEADLSAPGAQGLIERHLAFPALRGIRTPVAWDTAGRWRVAHSPGVMSDSRFLETSEVLACHDLCLELVVVPEQLHEVAALARTHPDLKIVLDHFAHLEPKLPGNASTWRAGIDALAPLPNVFLKVSGLWTVDRAWAPDILHPFLQHALSRIGPSRMLYGSNLPVERVNCPLERQCATLCKLFADVPEAGLRAIFSSTADAIYRVSEATASRRRSTLPPTSM